MAPTKFIQTQKASIRAAGRLARQATRAEFKYTQDVLGSIYGNLSKTISGTTAGLTGEQTRQLTALSTLRQNQAARSASISRNANVGVRTRYGSATAGGSAAEGLRSTRIAGKAGNLLVGSQAAAGGIVARGNAAAMSTLSAGVQEAQAGATGQLADALAYRAKNDAALQAQRQLTLDQMVLQNKLDIQKYKQELQLADAKNNTNGSMSAVATSAASATSALFNNFRNWVSADGTTIVPWDQARQDADGNWVDAEGNKLTPVSPAWAASKYLGDNGIDPASNEGQVVLSIARAMASAGAGTQAGAYTGSTQDVVNAVNQQMAILYPNFGKYQSTIDSLITASVNQEQVGPMAGSGPPVGGTNTDPPLGLNVAEGAVGGAITGGAIGSVVPGVGTAVGAGIGGFVGAASTLASALSGGLPTDEVIAKARRIAAQYKKGTITEAEALTALEKLGFS